MVCPKLDCKSEITQPCVVVFVEKDVGRLDISMDDSPLVQVGESFEDLSEYFPLGLFLLTPRVVFKKVLK